MLLKPHTAWTGGFWRWDGAALPWNKIQNTPNDIVLLTRFLVSTVKRPLRKPRRVA